MTCASSSKILIVDDELHIRKSLGDFLKIKGYEIRDAPDGVEALSALEEGGFFLVLTDITMPRMDGIALLHEIKKVQPQIDVIMITASQNVDMAIKAMREGAFDYFRKPFYFDEVILTIERVIEQRRLKHAALELEILKEKSRVEKRAMMEATLGLAQAVEEKDPYTKGHSERVANLSVELGRRLGFSEEKLQRIRITGLLHDVGKIAIPQEILSKRERLTEAEFLIIKKHPNIGARILSPISFLLDIIPGIRYHHESYDGTGYPDRLKGDEIPVEAMVIKVCDCFDAVTSDRPYRRPMTTEEAVRLIERESGKSLDPVITREFLQIIHEKQEALQEILITVS